MVLFYRTCGFATKGLILVARMHEMVASYDALLWSNAGPKRFFPGFLCYIFTTIASIIEYTDMGDK